MKISNFRLPLFALVVASGFFGAGAMTIIPLTFEQLCEYSDFIGVVRCTESGTAVASYLIEESWKGEAAGKTITIALPFFKHAQPTPRDGLYVVFAGKTVTKDKYLYSKMNGIAIEKLGGTASYLLPNGQGKFSLEASVDEIRSAVFTGSFKNKEELKNGVKAFLAKSAEARELLILRSIPAKSEGTDFPPAALDALKTNAIDDALNGVFIAAGSDTKANWLWTLIENAGPLTLKYLRENKEHGIPYANSYGRNSLNQLRIRCGEITWGEN